MIFIRKAKKEKEVKALNVFQLFRLQSLVIHFWHISIQVRYLSELVMCSEGAQKCLHLRSQNNVQGTGHSNLWTKVFNKASLPFQRKSKNVQVCKVEKIIPSHSTHRRFGMSTYTLVLVRKLTQKTTEQLKIGIDFGSLQHILPTP